MSRRKQSRPTRVAISNFDDFEEVANLEPKEKKPKLESEPSIPHVEDVCSASTPSTSSVTYTPTSTPSPSTSRYSGESQPNARRSDGISPLHMLEQSLTKLQKPAPSSLLSASPSGVRSGISELLRIVGQIAPTGTGQAGPVRRDGSEDIGMCSILKCLQCSRGFPSMEQLVKHMQDTKHFNNLPKSYSSLVQLERQKVLNLKLQVKSEGVKLSCAKCGELPTNIDRHLREVHGVRSSTDWLASVKVIGPDAKGTQRKSGTQLTVNSPHLNSLLSLINTVDHRK